MTEVEQQLEVADKQLRSTRAFLEEQAAEREAEREEWDRKLAHAQTDRKLSRVSRGSSLDQAEIYLDLGWVNYRVSPKI